MPDATVELPIFEETMLALIHIGEEGLGKPIEFDERDHFGFMAYAFCCKQVEHSKSMISLLKSGRLIDTLIVGRSMLEGMALLVWSNFNKEERAKKWRTYAYVSDYRQAMQNVANGLEVSDHQKKTIIAGLKEYGHLFLKTDEKYVADFKSDKFKSGWISDEDLKKVFTERYFREIGAEVNYQIYLDMSEWIHWNVRGFGLNLVRDETSISFNFRSTQSAAYSLSSSIQSIIHSFEVFDSHFQIGIMNSIKSIETVYLEKINSVRKEIQSTPS